MKTIKRNNYNDTKHLETQEIKIGGKSARVIYDSRTGLIEIILDHDLLRNCNQDKEFQPVILVEGFYQD